MPEELTDDQSSFWAKCWPRSLSPYGITKPQWVKTIIITIMHDKLVNKKKSQLLPSSQMHENKTSSHNQHSQTSLKYGHFPSKYSLKAACIACAWEWIIRFFFRNSKSALYPACVLSMLHSDGSVQDCSISSALAMEILQSCSEPSIWYHVILDHGIARTHHYPIVYTML